MDETTQRIMEEAVCILHGDTPPVWPSPLQTRSARGMEVPWVAARLREFDPGNLLDVGISLASLDYLGLLLEARRFSGVNLEAVDIVAPERVRTRYPETWWDDIESVPFFHGDIREIELPRARYDMVTCISVIEHIGFDIASVNDPRSAFVRADTPETVTIGRDPETDVCVMQRMRELLVPGGILLLTVPMGSGGAVLLRDSLGYYCAQWEYHAADWHRLLSLPGWKTLNTGYRGCDEELVWHEMPSAESLSGHRAEALSHSRGCALAVLQRV